MRGVSRPPAARGRPASALAAAGRGARANSLRSDTRAGLIPARSSRARAGPRPCSGVARETPRPSRGRGSSSASRSPARDAPAPVGSPRMRSGCRAPRLRRVHCTLLPGAAPSVLAPVGRAAGVGPGADPEHGRGPAGARREALGGKRALFERAAGERVRERPERGAPHALRVGRAQQEAKGPTPVVRLPSPVPRCPRALVLSRPGAPALRCSGAPVLRSGPSVPSVATSPSPASAASG